MSVLLPSIDQYYNIISSKSCLGHKYPVRLEYLSFKVFRCKQNGEFSELVYSNHSLIRNNGPRPCYQLNIVFLKTIFCTDNLYLMHAQLVIICKKWADIELIVLIIYGLYFQCPLHIFQRLHVKCFIKTNLD